MASRAAEQTYPRGQEHVEALEPRLSIEADAALAALSEQDDLEVVLSLDDLVQDERGEIVLYNDSNLRRMAITTDVAMADEGISGRHVTKSGESVTGFRYMLFANGMKLFYQDSLKREVRPASA